MCDSYRLCWGTGGPKDIGNRQYSSHASSPGSRTTQLTPQTQEPDHQFPPPETEDNDVVQKP